METSRTRLVNVVTGLPTVVPTAARDAEGAHLWKELPLIDDEEARFYLGYLIATARRALYDAQLFHDAMQERWGTAPTLPRCEALSGGAPAWITEADYDAYDRIAADVNAD